MSPLVPVVLRVEERDADSRLDAFLAEQFPQHSRVRLRRAITDGGVQVDGRGAKPAYRLRAGQCVSVTLPPLPPTGVRPEDVPLDILFEDEALAVVNKPAGMVVHPGKGHGSGTLAAALVHHFGRLSSTGGAARPGIVHRLDRDTSGVLLVAKTDAAHLALARQFEQRTVEKEYYALVVGQPDRDRDAIEQPIGIHPYQREKMAIRAEHSTSRAARTVFEVIERFRGFAALRVLPRTGRTHQIRVHLAHVGHPVLCDRLYGGRSRLLRGEIADDADDKHVLLDRQALHARRLQFQHPVSGEALVIESPLPDDMAQTLEALRRWRAL
jgi:23S rRNA pseudouridine1911/1915/1917 synthase